MKLDLIHFFDKDGLVDLNEIDYESAILLRGEGCFQFKVTPDRIFIRNYVFTVHLEKVVFGFWRTSGTAMMDLVTPLNTLVVSGEISVVSRPKSTLNTNHLPRVDIQYVKMSVL
jgi:hypothetical protein